MNSSWMRTESIRKAPSDGKRGQPDPMEKLDEGTLSKYVRLHYDISQGSYPNVWGTCIPMYSKLNLELFKALLHGYEDQEVVQWLQFSWPVSRLPNWPDLVTTFNKHARGQSIIWSKLVNTWKKR